MLRPPGVWSARTYGRIEALREERASYEWDPFWEYGAFIDVRDLSCACIAALTCRLDGHATLLVAAPDITTSGRTSRELTDFRHPGIDWRGGDEYDADPCRTLLDIEPAKRVLSWAPTHAWRSR